MLKTDLYGAIKSEDSEVLDSGLVSWAAREGLVE